MRFLPDRFSGLRTILLLFFNVLDTGYEVVPTQMVADFRELRWSEKLDCGDCIRAADRVLGIRIVQYQKQLGLRIAPWSRHGTGFPAYRAISEDAISLLAYDVGPVYSGAQVTTVRAQCLMCHARKVMTFSKHQRDVGFTRPFSLRPDELYDRKIEAKVGQLFRNLSQHYLGPTEDKS